jgi:UDP-N-acetylmuramate: L-alanyl-gamma-D-glutamyl-meso-diaminopimelate ligase
VENALAAIAAAQHVGIKPEIAVSALCTFTGVKRRLEIAASINNITIYDDFAHHPTAIEKTLKALRAKVGHKPIIAILQFASNTMKVGAHDSADVAAALNTADQIILLKPNFEVVDLCRHLTRPILICETVDEIVTQLCERLHPEDQVLLMSNKSFDGLRQKLVDKLQKSYV